MDIDAHKITQPFQLLAAWIVGMIVLVGEFLHTTLNTQSIWIEIPAFVISVMLSLIFIKTIFTLQTKYRPEMQDSEHYQEIWRNKYYNDIDKEKTLNMMEIIKNG